MRAKASLGLLAMVLVATAACGGDDDGSGGTTGSGAGTSNGGNTNTGGSTGGTGGMGTGGTGGMGTGGMGTGGMATGGTGGMGTGGMGMGGGGGIDMNNPCYPDCQALFDCTQDTNNGMQLCPGIMASDDVVFINECMANPQCGQIGLLVAQGCVGAINTLKGLDMTFAALCDGM